MEEYRDNNNFNRHERRKKPKRHALHGFIYLFLILCCCLIVFSIGSLTKSFMFIEDEPPIAPFPTSSASGSDFSFHTGSIPITHGNEDKTNSTPDAQSNEDETGFATDTQSNTEETAWYLILVNKWNSIPDGYEVELTELSNGQMVDKRIYPALQDMFDAARSNGVYPVVVSGYRTAGTQQRLLDEKIVEYRAAGYSATEARTNAEAWVAIPGTSEHQLGIAVDINADGIHSAGYEVYDWLEQNAHKYGFICRYPPDKTEITGVIGEAWHYRYVGIEAATEIYNQGVCLEEYLDSKN